MGHPRFMPKKKRPPATKTFRIAASTSGCIDISRHEAGNALHGTAWSVLGGMELKWLESPAEYGSRSLVSAASAIHLQAEVGPITETVSTARSMEISSHRDLLSAMDLH